ncbi:MAG: amidohydrolase family protein [Candidatus Binatia bacterium]
MNAAQRCGYDKVIDADGHILETPDAWEKYIDPPYRDRAIRIRTDSNGREYLEFNGRPSQFFNFAPLSQAGAMGRKDEEITATMEKTYREAAPFGAMDPKERVQLLDQEGLAAAILYPTLGLFWECEVEDIEISAAYCRAYNRWIVDFCSDSSGRLIPIAHISFGDPREAARELDRTVKAGAKGVFLAPFTPTNKAHAHLDHDLFWAKAQGSWASNTAVDGSSSTISSARGVQTDRCRVCWSNEVASGHERITTQLSTHKERTNAYWSNHFQSELQRLGPLRSGGAR